MCCEERFKCGCFECDVCCKKNYFSYNLYI